MLRVEKMKMAVFFRLWFFLDGTVLNGSRFKRFAVVLQGTRCAEWQFGFANGGAKIHDGLIEISGTMMGDGFGQKFLNDGFSTLLIYGDVAIFESRDEAQTIAI